MATQATVPIITTVPIINNTDTVNSRLVRLLQLSTAYKNADSGDTPDSAKCILLILSTADRAN